MATGEFRETSVHMVFVDDSTREHPERHGIGPLVGLGAVIVPPNSLSKYIDLTASTRDSLDVPADVELKWSPSSRDSWLRNPNNSDARKQLYESTLDNAIMCGIRSVVVVWDRGSVDWAEDDVKRELLKWLYERVSRYLETQDDEKRERRACGVVIADVPGGDRKSEKQWLADTIELTSYGTEYVQRDRIYMPIMTGWSHHIPHLQLADLVTSITTGAVAGSDYATHYIPRILKLAHTDIWEHLSGVGVKLFPLNTLGNLYHWVFDQGTAWDHGVVHLPCPNWRFPSSESTA